MADVNVTESFRSNFSLVRPVKAVINSIVRFTVLVHQAIMMIRNQAGAETSLGDRVTLPASWTSELRSTHPLVTWTPGHALTHVSPGNAGLGASEVGQPSDMSAVLVGVVTLEGPVRILTG